MPRSARALQLAAITATATAAWFGWHHNWPAFWFLLYVGFLLAVLAAGRNHHHQVVRERHEQARRAALLDDQTLAAPPSPCCSFWRHSEGKVHGPDCVRPPLPRREKGSAA
ncbi:hypothetical protein [Streptomyces griseorubiginosus]|uniref:hypothetical protein n=1 Tax=Streptomyces griseorubiginosus TaxID=67304 RepID=UPI0036F16B4C